MRSASVLASTVLAAVLLPAAVLAAKPATPEQPSAVKQSAQDQGAFFESVNVDIINVEVYVTDKQGKVVSGLGKDNFQVFEDGRPVTITNFYKVDVTTPRPGPQALPVPAPPNAPALVEGTPDEQRLSLIVYIDNFNLKPFNRNRVFRRVRDFLDRNVGPDDRVMLVTYNRSFKERVAFTNDPTLVNSTLFDIEKETGQNVHRDSDREDVIKAIDDSKSLAEAMSHARPYAQSLFNDTQVSIDAIKKLVDNLGGLPGRKAILYVSEGLPMVSGDDVYQMLNEKYKESSVLMEAREYDSARRIDELAAQANANRVTFYTIDAGGLRTLSSGSAERATAGEAGIATYIDSQNIFNLQSPLLKLAEDTGGKAIINTNDVGPQLDQVANDLRSYYSLGYQPAHAGDGRYHEIEVKLKQKGLQIRHRAGYRDKSIEQRMTDGTMASLLYGDLSNPLGVEVSFGTPTRRDDGNSLVPVHLRIPLDRVTLIPQTANHEGRLRAFVAVMDEDNRLSPVQAVPIAIEFPSTDVAAARAKGWGYDITLLMRRGPQKVAVGVRDELGGTSSYVSRAISVE
jgi:VWFA-related protein